MATVFPMKPASSSRRKTQTRPFGLFSAGGGENRFMPPRQGTIVAVNVTAGSLVRRFPGSEKNA